MDVLACTKRNALNVLQEPGGWESSDMVRRYAHLAADHLIDYAENIASKDTIMAQNENVQKLRLVK